MLRGFPGGSVVKNLPAKAGDAGDSGSIPGFGRSPEGGSGNPLPSQVSRNAWEIPWTEEPGQLQSMESQRVGYDLTTTVETNSLRVLTGMR